MSLDVWLVAVVQSDMFGKKVVIVEANDLDED